MTPSPNAREFYDIYDISYSHIADPKEEIWNSVIEEKFSFHFTQAFSNDSSILNSVQSLPVIASENEEEFDFSLSNVAAGVQKSNTLNFLELILDCMSDQFTLFDLELLANSYMIASTNT